MIKLITILLSLMIPSIVFSAASIVPAWNNYSCAVGKSCTGSSINSAKQGTNSAYWGGTNGVSIGLDKSNGKDTISINGPVFIGTGGITTSLSNGTVTISNNSPITINCTGGNQIEDVILFNRVAICKADSTANTITIIDSTPRSILLDPLSVQGECVELVLSSGVWYVK